MEIRYIPTWSAGMELRLRPYIRLRPYLRGYEHTATYSVRSYKSVGAVQGPIHAWVGSFQILYTPSVWHILKVDVLPTSGGIAKRTIVQIDSGSRRAYRPWSADRRCEPARSSSERREELVHRSRTTSRLSCERHVAT